MSAVSSNHFQEFKCFVGLVQKFLPSVKILIYDLGLLDHDRSQIASPVNAEYCWLNSLREGQICFMLFQHRCFVVMLRILCIRQQ